jgi:hypothetical protein
MCTLMLHDNAQSRQRTCRDTAYNEVVRGVSTQAAGGTTRRITRGHRQRQWHCVRTRLRSPDVHDTRRYVVTSNTRLAWRWNPRKSYPLGPNASPVNVAGGRRSRSSWSSSSGYNRARTSDVDGANTTEVESIVVLKGGRCNMTHNSCNDSGTSTTTNLSNENSSNSVSTQLHECALPTTPHIERTKLLMTVDRSAADTLRLVTVELLVASNTVIE